MKLPFFFLTHGNHNLLTTFVFSLLGMCSGITNRGPRVALSSRPFYAHLWPEVPLNSRQQSPFCSILAILHDEHLRSSTDPADSFQTSSKSNRKQL